MGNHRGLTAVLHRDFMCGILPTRLPCGTTRAGWALGPRLEIGGWDNIVRYHALLANTAALHHVLTTLACGYTLMLHRRRFRWWWWFLINRIKLWSLHSTIWHSLGGTSPMCALMQNLGWLMHSANISLTLLVIQQSKLPVHIRPTRSLLMMRPACLLLRYI